MQNFCYNITIYPEHYENISDRSDLNFIKIFLDEP